MSSENNEKIEKNEDLKVDIVEKTEKVKEKSDNKKTENKQEELIVKQEEKKSLEKSKKKIYIAFNIIIFLIFIMFVSIIFALININNEKIINGVSIKNINLSGLSIKDAKNKVEEAINVEIDKEINLIFEDKKIFSLNPSEIEFAYEVSDKIEEAYNVGRDSNIFVNNYKIIYSALLGNSLDLDYTYNEEKLNEIVNSLDGLITGLVVDPSYYREEDNLIIVPGIDGISIEKEKLKKIILDEIRNRDYEKIINNEYSNDITIPIIDTKAKHIDIEKIHSEIYCQPKDAYYVAEPFELHMDEDGIDFNITIEEAKKIIEIPAEEYTIPLKITKANVTINDIDSSAFRYEVSRATTNYDPGYTSRVNNLRLAASKINGKVLAPGEIFSYNEVVGKRTVEAGYTNAPIFINGEVADGTGGGICQISTTLYQAVLKANLKIVDRRNHNYITSYAQAGTDATVVYGAIDFKFQNTRKYPIKIEATVNGGVVKFVIYGIEEEKEYDVKIIPIVTQSMAKKTKYVDDPTLAEGSEVVKQVGTSGCKVTTYKEVYLNGSFVSKEIISNDTYKAMDRIVRRGTKKISVPTVSTPTVTTPPVSSTPEPTLPEQTQTQDTTPENTTN